MSSDDSMLNLRGLGPVNDGSASNSGAGFEVFSSVLKYCSLILVLPIATFFATKSAIATGMDQNSSSVYPNVISAIVAVLVLHIGLAVFIYKAYFETDTPKAKIGKQE